MSDQTKAGIPILPIDPASPTWHRVKELCEKAGQSSLMVLTAPMANERNCDHARGRLELIAEIMQLAESPTTKPLPERLKNTEDRSGI